MCRYSNSLCNILVTVSTNSDPLSLICSIPLHAWDKLRKIAKEDYSQSIIMYEKLLPEYCLPN